MALEQQIDRLNTNLEALIAALAKAPTISAGADKPARASKTSQPPAAETAPTPIPVAAEQAPVAAEASISKDQVKLAVVSLIKKDGNQTRATEILSKYKAQNLSTLAPEHYAAVHAEATKLAA